MEALAKRLIFLVEGLAELAEKRSSSSTSESPRILAGRRWATTHAPVPGWRAIAQRVEIAQEHRWPWLVRPHGGVIGSFSAWRKKIALPEADGPQQALALGVTFGQRGVGHQGVVLQAIRLISGALQCWPFGGIDILCAKIFASLGERGAGGHEMKIGLIPANIGSPTGEMMIGMAKLAEQVGFESIWTFEHVIIPIDYESKYPYSADGKMGVDPDANFVDPLIALSAIAAATKTIRLGTGVNILSQANPLYVAKQAASLDFVSGGRFELGVGIGWLREEFKACGTPFERRGARFDDYVQAMRKVWSGDVVEHQSEFLDWTNSRAIPRPFRTRFRS